MFPSTILLFGFRGLLLIVMFLLVVVSLLTIVSFLFPVISEPMESIELLFSFFFVSCNLLFSWLLVEFDPFSQLLDGIIYFSSHDGRKQVDLFKSLSYVDMMSEAWNLFCLFFFLFLLFLLLFGDLFIFFQFFGNNNFCSFFEFLLPFFIIRRFQLLDLLILFLLSFLHFPCCIFWPQIITILNKGLAIFDLLEIWVSINVLFSFLLKFLFSFFLLFLSLFISELFLFSFFLPLFELFLFLLFTIFSFFFTFYLFFLSLLDFFLFLSDHFDIAD